MKSDHVLVFTCNWNAYSGIEAAGRKHLAYPANVHTIRVLCLGQIGPGIILKAFEQGAKGVLLLGCKESECQYDFGNRRAEQIVSTTKAIVNTLGYPEHCLGLECLDVEDGQAFVRKVESFIERLSQK